MVRLSTHARSERSSLDQQHAASLAKDLKDEQDYQTIRRRIKALNIAEAQRELDLAIDEEKKLLAGLAAAPPKERASIESRIDKINALINAIRPYTF